MLEWFSKNKFQAHLLAFTLMVLTSVGMIFALRREAYLLTWLMIAIFAIANVLTLFVK